MIRAAAAEVFAAKGASVEYKVGTMIEVPRGALRAGDLASHAEFFSFGTNDLTQVGLPSVRVEGGEGRGGEARMMGPGAALTGGWGKGRAGRRAGARPGLACQGLRSAGLRACFGQAPTSPSASARPTRLPTSPPPRLPPPRCPARR